MNSMDILDAIGAVDDVLLKKAKEKQKSHKAVWTAIGSLAACFLLLVTLPMAFIVFRGADSMAPECADQANGEEMGSDYVYVRIDVASSKDESFPAYSAESASKPKKGEYIITLHHNDGSIREYRLFETTLTDLTTRETYSLTKEQANYLISLIKK